VEITFLKFILISRRF